jgi:large conductance mechanosensitive channel
MGKMKKDIDIDIEKVKNGTKNFWTEFKAFALKGNVVDMAIGMVIGAAFTSIINSLVKDIITPLIGLLTKGLDFSSLFVALDGNTYATLAEAQEAGAAVLTYGNFVTAVINFLIVALTIFIILKKLLVPKKKKVEEAPAVPTEKDCPFCKSKIHIDATRCPHCTSVLQ